MQTYIRQLVHEVRKENARLEIMGSHGGTLRPDEVEEYPYLTLLSGPSAGVAAAISLGSGIGINNIITFDMGGTSTDVCLIRNGLPSFRNQAELSGIPVLGRMIDIHTVGAGGGSIARFDAGGALRVGPQSAGARPGPAAYGHGGPFTVSDAHFITGTLPGSNLLNGAFPVFTDRARAAAEALADQQPAQCHLEPMQIAEGVIQLANQIMAGAIRKISVERGYDPDDFTLCAFGGAGGLHACDLADSLGMKRVWFPPHPGLFSAIGMALCRRRRVWTHSILEDSNDQQFSGFEARIGDLWKQALAEADEAGIPLSAISLEGVLGMRYRGQAFELEIPYSKDFLEQFHENHQRRFGWSDPTKTVQLIYLHLVASGPEPEWREAFETSRSGQTANVEKPTRTMVFRRGMYTESDCIQREALCPGETRTGAIIIQEYSGTLWIPPGWKIISKPGNHLIAEKNASPREN
jgi:N-methylhydantoinase A